MNITLHPHREQPTSPAPRNHADFQIGDRVRVEFRGKTHEAIIKTMLDAKSVVVVGEDLLLPVACSRTELEAMDD